MIKEVIVKYDDNGITNAMGEVVGSIVRCKDCIQNTLNTDGTNECWCYKFGYAVEDTDFCSDGERIDNE